MENEIGEEFKKEIKNRIRRGIGKNYIPEKDWAGEPEIALLTKKYKINIEVFDKYYEKKYKYIGKEEEDIIAGKMLRINRKHYQLIKKIKTEEEIKEEEKEKNKEATKQKKKERKRKIMKKEGKEKK